MRYLGVVLIILFQGCSMMMPAIPPHLIKEAFDEIDGNHDGGVTLAEYGADYRREDLAGLKEEAENQDMSVEEFLQWSFKKMDTDGDGKMTLEEYSFLVNSA